MILLCYLQPMRDFRRSDIESGGMYRSAPRTTTPSPPCPEWVHDAPPPCCNAVRCRTGGSHSLQFTMAWIAAASVPEWLMTALLIQRCTHTHTHLPPPRTHTQYAHPYSHTNTHRVEEHLTLSSCWEWTRSWLTLSVTERKPSELVATISVYHTCRECTSHTYFTLLNQSVNCLGVSVFCFSELHTVKPQSPSDLSGCCYHQWGVKSEQRWGCIPAVSMYTVLITQWPYSLVIHVLHSSLGRLPF